MTALLAAEVLKLRTTRLLLWLGLILVGVVALSVAAPIATADEFGDAFGQSDWESTVVSAAGVATLFALLAGVLSLTAEYRHGTVAWTFLATPKRERVVLAKGIVSALAGVGLALLAAAVALAIAVPWLSSRGTPLELASGELWRNVGGLLVACAFWGALGVGLGGIVRNQVAAVVLALIWFPLIEPIIGAINNEVGRYLPSSAVDALLGGAATADPLPRPAALALTLAYVAVFWAAGAFVASRRDVA
ncbi:MAG TPA: ABC transporter permease subunit [Gaiellaceae bacterium]|nr:ABC transporter permease subunit [Gaiellaceae bacterium]